MMTETMRNLQSLAIAMTMLLLPATALAGPATVALKAKNGEVDRLLHNKVEKGSPEEAKQKADIKAMAAGLLDYDELAKKSLASHWDKLTTAQRTEFVTTFRELIERNYVKQLRSNLDYQVQYKGEETNGDDVTVTTIVKVKSAGKNTDAEIVYKMHKVGNEWRVWDVITDEVPLTRNYKTQFNKIITEQSYDALIAKMKKKLAEKD
ncbi:MAG TPA: ABC transporter substrate-binding protein [Polyangia bacterium]|nr:ABC transporter substrate-binding protein [Polyangia bacterium]